MTENAFRSYDKTSPMSIFEYAFPLIDHSLREVVGEGAVESYQPSSKNKGGLGQMVEELYYHYKANSSRLPDFVEAGVELKTTGLKELKKSGNLQIKERLVIDIINFCEVVNQPFEDSLFYTKFRLLLLLFYFYEKGVKQEDLRFILVALWQIPEKDLLIIRHDYEKIIDKIRRGEAHLLSDGDTDYLSASRKGNKGEKPRVQPFSDKRAPQRCFALKAAYMRTVLSYIERGGKRTATNYKIKVADKQLFKVEQLQKHSFEDLLLERFEEYKGNSYRQLCSLFGRNYDTDKSKYAHLASRIATGKFTNVNLTEEFRKAGLQLKTIRVEADGNINESMSFENIDYQEMMETTDWYDSRLYEIFSGRFLFVIFKADGGTIKYKNRKGDWVEENTYAFDKAFFWTMPQNDLNLAEEYWSDIQGSVIDNHISPEYFWKLDDHRKFHVRPKGSDSRDLVDNPHGGKVKKYCYWFNNEYVKEIVKNNA